MRDAQLRREGGGRGARSPSPAVTVARRLRVQPPAAGQGRVRVGRKAAVLSGAALAEHAWEEKRAGGPGGPAERGRGQRGAGREPGDEGAPSPRSEPSKPRYLLAAPGLRSQPSFLLRSQEDPLIRGRRGWGARVLQHVLTGMGDTVLTGMGDTVATGTGGGDLGRPRVTGVPA